jgi:glutaconate CoA-transferase subunit B
VAVVTDLGVYEPDTESKELRLTRLQPSVTVDDARMATGWDL